MEGVYTLYSTVSNTQRVIYHGRELYSYIAQDDQNDQNEQVAPGRFTTHIAHTLLLYLRLRFNATTDEPPQLSHALVILWRNVSRFATKEPVLASNVW